MKNTFIVLIAMAILICPALLAGQNVIQVTAGDDQIDAALLQAQAGDTLELITDGGIYHESLQTLIDIPITIRAAAGLVNKPVWTTNQASRNITLSASLTLDGIIFDGAQGDSLTKDGIRFGTGVTGINLIINNCVFRNFSNGQDGHAIKATTGVQLDTVIITNSRFEHIAGEGISFKDTNPGLPPGLVKYFRCEYSTFWDCGDEAIYVRDHDNDSSTDPQPEFLVNHITVVGVTSKAIYPKEINGAVIKNTISAYNAEYPARIYNTNSVAKNILFYQCPKNYISRQDNATIDYDLILKDQNPYFADVENGDFAVAANSPAALFADDGTALGDTNNGTWDASAITKWELVKNRNWGNLIKKALTEKDTVVFVTDGGVYHAPGSVSLPKISLTLMAEPGLKKKPIVEADSNSSRLIKFYGPITIKGLKFVGDGVTEGTPYAVRADAGGENLGTLRFEDCEFENFRLRAIHLDKNNYADSLIVNNCFFKGIGETGVYGKDAARNIGVARITNSTFYKVGQKGIYLRNVGDLEVSHCTFFYNDSTISKRGGNVGVLARDDTVAVIRDNIFVKQKVYGAKVYGPSPTVEYNLFWECDTLIKSVDHPELTFPIFNFEDDPMFKSTVDSTLDLALEENSPAVGAASDGGNLGDPRWGTWTASTVSEDTPLPNSFQLEQNYPNPFNPATTIKFSLPESTPVTLTIYNLIGQKVATLVNQKMYPGIHGVTWKAKEAPSGIYFYKIVAGDYVKVRKMTLLK